MSRYAVETSTGTTYTVRADDPEHAVERVREILRRRYPVTPAFGLPPMPTGQVDAAVKRAARAGEPVEWEQEPAEIVCAPWRPRLGSDRSERGLEHVPGIAAVPRLTTADPVNARELRGIAGARVATIEQMIRRDYALASPELRAQRRAELRNEVAAQIARADELEHEEAEPVNLCTACEAQYLETIDGWAGESADLRAALRGIREACESGACLL